jgi:predicted SprT family Zn-dependent metalloprotease
MAYYMKDRSYNTCGLYFDLQAIFNELNNRFFAAQIEAKLRWGQRRVGAQAKRAIRLGSYHPRTKIITINPCLDQAIVPKICLERIVFHEMVHQYLPAKKSPAGKNLIHHKEFNTFEKSYPYLREADLWLESNLCRLLRY